jgi:hypothetical protein
MADDTAGAPGVSDWHPKLKTAASAEPDKGIALLRKKVTKLKLNTENGAELQLRLLGNSGYLEKRRGSHPETLVTK